MKHNTKILIFAAGLLSLAIPAFADTTYNLTAAEDANSGNLNPDGVWTFLAGTTVLPFNLIPASGSCLTGYPGLSSDYAAGNVSGNCLPAFAVASGIGPGTPADFLAGDVVVHSWDSHNGDSNGQAFVTWTAPVSGTITIAGSIWYAMSAQQRSNDFILSLGVNTLDTGTVAYNSVGGYDRAHPITLSGGGTFSVNAGDMVALEILMSPGQDNGSVAGIDLTITETGTNPTPEPGTLLLLGSAFGALARVRRRLCEAR